MTRATPHAVTPAQWLALVAVWALAGYGALASPKAEVARDQSHLVACGR